MGNPCVENIRDAIMPAPQGAHGRQHIAFIGRARTPDHKIHGAMLPQVELAGLRRGHGRPSELAETHVPHLDRSADPIRG